MYWELVMESNPNVFDVAQFILERGAMSHMRLQKLVYYCQAWSLVWDDSPLFKEPIEAWINGPVCSLLYDRLRGLFQVHQSSLSSCGDASKLSASQKETVNEVLNYYGDRDAQWLSDLTHMEDPWLEARAGLPTNSRTNREITHASMHEYYSGLLQN